MKPICLSFLLLLAFFRSMAQAGYYLPAADGVKIYVQEFGSGDPIVLLAGGPGFDAVYLEPIWQRLSATHRCIVPDQRGTGKSVVPVVDSTTLNLARYVDDLEVLRRHLGLKKLTLVGHSWGGMLAQAYAARYPARTARLILLSPGGPTVKFMTYFPDNMALRIREEDRAASRLPLSGYFFDRARALETAQRLDLLAIMPHPEAFPIVIGDYGRTEAVRVKGLKKYKGPVALIQGRQDPIGEGTIYEIKSILPQTRIAMIEKCGHFPWHEQEAAVQAFFAQLMAALR